MISTYQRALRGNLIGVVFGTFAPLHQGHLDLIMRAKKECDGGCVVLVDGRDNDRGGSEMPLKRRYRYIREFFSDDDLVSVYAIDETALGIPEYPNGWEGFLEEAEKILASAAIGTKVFYVAEQEYADYLNNRGYEVRKIDRTENPISATMIRENPYKYWDKIALPFKRVFSTNILICGTPSEGKTTLTADLGKYFNTVYSHEYARDYMKESCISEWELDGADYFAFLDGQYRMNKALINSSANKGIFFADSDSMTTQLYAEYYSKDSEIDLTEEEAKEIVAAAQAITKKCKWDRIYLLVPRDCFVDDHTRCLKFAGLEERNEQFKILTRIIEEAGNWDKVVILQGNYWENFKKITSDVKGFIKNGKLD